MPLTTMGLDSQPPVRPNLIDQEPKFKGIPFWAYIKRKTRTGTDHSVVQVVNTCPTYGPVDLSTSISAIEIDQTCFSGGRSGFLAFWLSAGFMYVIHE